MGVVVVISGEHMVFIGCDGGQPSLVVEYLPAVVSPHRELIVKLQLMLINANNSEVL